MTLSARDVAAVLRERLPGLTVKKLHKLLYYCQGHHLAVFGEPLFAEAVSAWDMGPVVGELWYAEKQGTPAAPPAPPDQAALNTIGYVLSRYGALTGEDLERLSHNEDPWRLANARRSPGGSVRIERDWLREYFRDEGAPDAGVPSDPAWLRDAPARLAQPAHPDSPEEIRRRLARAA
ncbi:MAG TPA: type II toxin-antitoxin system antitoxin SocA domain-containing protein [Rugosimonospora sp.]|nr:type II toxin-antitoxin system antitoxin SocA domain-containing protein [Rugosimonospora sp.]